MGFSYISCVHRCAYHYSLMKLFITYQKKLFIKLLLFSAAAYCPLSEFVVFCFYKQIVLIALLSRFPATEWVKGKQLEEVVTIKNT